MDSKRLEHIIRNVCIIFFVLNIARNDSIAGVKNIYYNQNELFAVCEISKNEKCAYAYDKRLKLGSRWNESVKRNLKNPKEAD